MCTWVQSSSIVKAILYVIKKNATPDFAIFWFHAILMFCQEFCITNVFSFSIYKEIHEGLCCQITFHCDPNTRPILKLKNALEPP